MDIIYCNDFGKLKNIAMYIAFNACIAIIIVVKKNWNNIGIYCSQAEGKLVGDWVGKLVGD